MPIMVKQYAYSEGFAAEVSSLVLARHPHIIKLLGISFSDAGPCAVLESMPTIEDDLLLTMNKVDKLRILVALSDALVYLHYRRILLLDIKLKNIVINFRFKLPKFANWNLSRNYMKNAVDNFKSDM